MVALNEQVSEKPTVIEVKKVEPTPISDEDFEKAQKGFQQGKKFLVLNKFDEAVSNFDEACQIFSKKYGELNVECADLYFFYGKALLELARVENTVLGNALNGIPEDSAAPINDSRYGNPDEVEEKERETIAEKVIDAMCEPEAVNNEEVKKDDENMQVENNDEHKKESSSAAVVEPVNEQQKVEIVEEKPKDEIKESSEEKEKEAKNENVDEIKAVEENGEKLEKKDDEAEVEGDEEDVDEEGEDEEGEAEGEGEDAENDDISNLQRSWEMFELAKLVYKNNTDKDKIPYTKRIAECLLKLGEISIEQELYEQAINDINESIKIQEDDLLKENRDERLLAETYYQLGLAQQFSNQYKLANESYQRSINILQIRIDKLNNELTNSTLDDDNKKQINDEIKELEAILPEITTKLDECNEQDQQNMNLVKEAKECFINKINGTNGSTTATNNEEVKDITSLVKSKRKINEVSTSPSKKTKLEGDENEQNNTEASNGNNDQPQEQPKEQQIDVEVSEPQQ